MKAFVKSLDFTSFLFFRFYSIESSYIHGGKYCEGEPEEPVIGQNVTFLLFASFYYCRLIRDCSAFEHHEYPLYVPLAFLSKQLYFFKLKRHQF